MKYIKFFLIFFSIFFLFYILYLVWGFLLEMESGVDSCKENINHKQVLEKKHNSYVNVIDYYLSCGEICDVKLIWRWCWEWKQCYRRIFDEVFSEKIRSSQVWSMKKINSNLIEVVPYDSIDNTSDHFGIWTRYLPCYRYLFIYNSSLRQKESDLLLSRAKKLMDNWYVILEPN